MNWTAPLLSHKLIEERVPSLANPISDAEAMLLLHISCLGIKTLTLTFEVRATATEQQAHQLLTPGLDNLRKPSFHIHHEASWENLWKLPFAVSWMQKELTELLTAFPSLLDHSRHMWSPKALFNKIKFQISEPLRKPSKGKKIIGALVGSPHCNCTLILKQGSVPYAKSCGNAATYTG